MTSPSSPSDAERMDRHYRFQRHIYDWTRTHYLIGRKHLIRQLTPRDGETVLEIGCGTAWNLIRAARRYPMTRFHGVDVSNAMLRTAAAAATRAGLDQRIVLRQGDARDFNAEALFGIATFDRLFFSYALTMIPGWKEALEHAVSLIKPGGHLLIVDFGLCENLPSTFRKTLGAFLAHYTVYPRTDLQPVLTDLAARHQLKLQIDTLHRGYTVFATLTRT